ncbi:MAG: division/cell wall cluster transcriptional repressor MraZ [Pseudomonadota bacterium]
MDRFFSHFILRLDAKGRVSVPAPFRSVLTREGAETLFCYPALDRPAVEAGGARLMAEIEDLIGRFPPFSEEREQFATALYGTSETLKIDGEGRVTLSDQLKDHAGIMDAVAFVGLGHKFQIWAPDRFSARLSEATGKMRALKKRLGTGQAATPQGARE